MNLSKSPALEPVAMPSLFPGMDPYLESQPFWSVLHTTLVPGMMADIKKRLPPGYSV